MMKPRNPETHGAWRFRIIRNIICVLAFSFNVEMGVEFLKSKARPDNSQNIGRRAGSKNILTIINWFPQKPYPVPCLVWGLRLLRQKGHPSAVLGKPVPAVVESPFWGSEGCLMPGSFQSPLSLPSTTQRSTCSLRPPLLPARISRFVLFCNCIKPHSIPTLAEGIN